MYTSHKIHTHNKCLAILELIQKVNNRIEVLRSDLARFDNSSWDMPIRLMNKREDYIEAQEYYKKVKERLVRYYYRTFETLMPTELEAPTLFTQKTEL